MSGKYIIKAKIVVPVNQGEIVFPGSDMTAEEVRQRIAKHLPSSATVDVEELDTNHC